MKTEIEIRNKIREIEEDRDRHQFFKFHKTGEIDILKWVLGN